MPLLQKVIAGVKEEFADSVAYGGGIYAVGYCFGGKYVLLLSAQSRYALEHDETKTEAAPEADEISRIKAGALAHGMVKANAPYKSEITNFGPLYRHPDNQAGH